MGAVADTFYEALLGKLSVPADHTAIGVYMCWGWQACEGGTARNNPFDTTFYQPGASPYNTFFSGGHAMHVWDYPTEATGIAATVATLFGLADYVPIIAALRAGDPAAFGAAVDASPWGTRGVAAYLAAHPYRPPAPPAPPPAPPAPPAPTPAPAGDVGIDMTEEQLTQAIAAGVIAALNEAARQVEGITSFADYLSALLQNSRAIYKKVYGQV